jgi:hypothetical protein
MNLRIGKWTLAALALGACSDDGPYALDREGGAVVVTEIYRECLSDADCVLVRVSCDGCCQRDAIASELGAEFEAAREEACRGYSGAECDCDIQPATARCMESRCIEQLHRR